MEKILDLQNQSSLAKLLATENITVTHSKSLRTAYFDVKNRVLGLPVWKDKGKVVYDMLVGHEVSHALYTDHAEFEKFIEEEGRGNFDILNIIEDIRIERLIKMKYAGMPRIFNGAYKQLVEADFFGAANKDITAMSFLDRLNLRAKVGPYIDVPLNPIEEDIFDRCLQAETFDDVVKLYHEVKKFMNDQKKEEQPQDDDEQSTVEEQSKGDSDETSEDTPMEESSDDSSADNIEDDGEESFTQAVTDALEDDGSTEETESAASDSTEPNSAMPSASVGASKKSDSNGKDIDLTNESETMKSFDENALEEQEGDLDSYDRDRAPAICLWPTKTTIEKHIIPYKSVLSQRDLASSDLDAYDPNYLELAAARSILFKKNLNKKVGVLVREFERRKASYQYSRAQESRRGSLDVNNLYKYKYDDQIFQTTMKLADAKSHGLIFFIDYSGSMSRVLRDVLEHTLNLVHFCKKVGIPFEVYSFTSNYSLNDSDVEQSDYEFDMKDLVLATLFSSDMSKAEYKIAFDQVVDQISFSSDTSFSQWKTSPFEHLGGTPLDATLMAAHHVVKKFNEKHGVQKTNVIFLTDGESHRCSPNATSCRAPSYITVVGGKQHIIPRHNSTTSVLTKMLGDITGATTIGWYLPSDKATGTRHLRSMAFSSAKENYWSDITKKWIVQYRKDGFFNALNCFGYDSYFLLKSDIKIKDEEFAYKPNNDKSLSDNRGEQSKLAREFAKHNVKNRQNRIIMTKFAETIA